MPKRQIGFVAMATWLLLSVAFAQATSNAQTHNLSGAFWRVDGGFVSTLRIKNNLVVAPLQVMPTLYMADGTRYPLPPVNLAVGGVASISINDALLQAAASIPGHISEFGSVEVTYQHSSPGHVMAFVQALDVPRSLSLEWPLMEKMTPIPGVSEAMTAPGPQTVEGLWWKRDAGVSGSVMLTNTTSEEQPVTVQLTGTDGKSTQHSSIQLAPHATHQFALDSLAGATGLLRHDAGGVRIQYNGEMGDVVVGGGLLNAEEGYSANMPFWWHDPSSQTAPMRYASAGLMVGKPDPALRFPAETIFSPYLALRNASSVRMELTIELNYMEGSTPVSRTLPTVLGAGEARQIDMTGLMAAFGIKDLNGSINVGVSFSGRTGDLIIANGSVDQTGTYVFEVKPQPVTSGRRRIGDHWSIANGNDTMLSLWNPTGQTEDVEVTFLYGDGSGRYVMEFHLAAGASAALDLKQLIAQGVPDKNGNLIPPGVEEGSVMLANVQGPTKPFTLAVALAVYNVANATCCGQCTNCCGPSSFTITPGNFVMAVGQQMTCTCTETDCTGAQFTVSGTWSSSNTSVMTVASTTGMVTGVSPGTANISVDLGIMQMGSGCIPNGCPTGHPVPGTGGTALSVSQSPTTLNMSVGDTSKAITVTITPSAAVVNLAFSQGLQSNPNSSSTATVNVPGNTSASGTVTSTISASGTNSPSAIYSALACASGVCASQGTTIYIPPQVLIQLLYGEAHGQAVSGDSVSEPAVGSTIKNRFGRSEFPGGTAATYQAVIISSQYAGIATSVLTGIEPELDNSVSLFNGIQADIVSGSPCFFSPTASDWSRVQAALASGTTTVPTLSQDPLCYGGSTPGRQIVYKSSVPNNVNGSGAPAFLFERQKTNDSNPAVVQIN